MATNAAINPFPNDVRAAFDSYITSPQYSRRNRERIPYERWCQMCKFLTNPTLKSQNSTKSNLKHRALTDFYLIHEKLYRNYDIAHKELRYVVLEIEALPLANEQHWPVDWNIYNVMLYTTMYIYLPRPFVADQSWKVPFYCKVAIKLKNLIRTNHQSVKIKD